MLHVNLICYYQRQLKKPLILALSCCAWNTRADQALTSAVRRYDGQVCVRSPRCIIRKPRRRQRCWGSRQITSPRTLTTKRTATRTLLVYVWSVGLFFILLLDFTCVLSCACFYTNFTQCLHSFVIKIPFILIIILRCNLFIYHLLIFIHICFHIFVIY